MFYCWIGCGVNQMKQFTIITKDGSKWLSRTAPHGVDPIQWRSDNHDLPYIGSAEPGTSLSEEQVKEIRQHRHKDDPKDAFFNLNSDTLWLWDNREEHRDIEFRIAYTDAELPDIDYEKEMPHKQWPSTKYVAHKVGAESHTLPEFDEILNNTSDDAKMNVSLQMDLNYWKRRCEAAERYISESPCDPDITKTQNAA